MKWWEIRTIIANEKYTFDTSSTPNRGVPFFEGRFEFQTLTPNNPDSTHRCIERTCGGREIQ